MSGTFSDFMAELAAEFRRELPGQDTALAAAWAEAQGGGDPAAGLARLRGVAHRLAGQGLTFGYPEISIRAEGLERALIAVQPVATLADEVGDLRRAIADAVEDPGLNGEKT